MESRKDERLPNFCAKTTESLHLCRLRRENILENRYWSIFNGEETCLEAKHEDESLLDARQAFDKGKHRSSALIVTSWAQKPSYGCAKSFQVAYNRYEGRTTNKKLCFCTKAFSLTIGSRSMSDHIAELETIFAMLEDIG